MNRNEIQEAIEGGRTALGIEFGSTRIKAVLTGEDLMPVASGSHEWKNRHENGIWTYSLDDVWSGLRACYGGLQHEVIEAYGVQLRSIGAIGFSGMMHGYMAFDEQGELLVPFRTYRNTMTEEAAKDLTQLFQWCITERSAGRCQKYA